MYIWHAAQTFSLSQFNAIWNRFLYLGLKTWTLINNLGSKKVQIKQKWQTPSKCVYISAINKNLFQIFLQSRKIRWTLAISRNGEFSQNLEIFLRSICNQNDVLWWFWFSLKYTNKGILYSYINSYINLYSYNCIHILTHMGPINYLYWVRLGEPAFLSWAGPGEHAHKMFWADRMIMHWKKLLWTWWMHYHLILVIMKKCRFT